eukprot:448193-Alexandrium_andersonii.AAC.1
MFKRNNDGKAVPDNLLEGTTLAEEWNTAKKELEETDFTGVTALTAEEECNGLLSSLAQLEGIVQRCSALRAALDAQAFAARKAAGSQRRKDAKKEQATVKGFERTG